MYNSILGADIGDFLITVIFSSVKCFVVSVGSNTSILLPIYCVCVTISWQPDINIETLIFLGSVSLSVQNNITLLISSSAPLPSAGKTFIPVIFVLVVKFNIPFLSTNTGLIILYLSVYCNIKLVLVGLSDDFVADINQYIELFLLSTI